VRSQTLNHGATGLAHFLNSEGICQSDVRGKYNRVLGETCLNGRILFPLLSSRNSLYALFPDDFLKGVIDSEMVGASDFYLVHLAGVTKYDKIKVVLRTVANKAEKCR